MALKRGKHKKPSPAAVEAPPRMTYKHKSSSLAGIARTAESGVEE